MEEPTVLIVEDREDLRDLIRMSLEPLTKTCMECSDVEEAWRLIETYRPQVAVLDQSLARPLDGLELCRKIKADQYLDTRVVLVTGSVQRESVERGYAAGADAYVTKPFNPTELLDVVRSLSR